MKLPDRPIRILFTIPNFITAGSGRAMLNIVERLDRQRFDPAVAIQRAGGELDRYVTETLGLPLIVAPFTVSPRPLLLLPFRAWRASRAFRRFRFDIWHSFHYASDYTEPLVARLAGSRHWVYTKKNSWWHARSWLARTRLARRVIALNSSMTDELFAPAGQAHKVVTIPRGVDGVRFRPATLHQPPDDLRKRLGLAPDDVLLASTARLDPRKGLEQLLDACEPMQNVHLVLAGRPGEESYAEQLDSRARSLGSDQRVHRIGHVADVAALLQQADLFVLPSFAEGMPVALLEAMATGVPSVATSLGGTRDVIEDGVNGLLVPVGDVAALRDAIDRLASDPELRTRIGAAGRERVTQHFTLEQEARAHEELYLSLYQRAATP